MEISQRAMFELWQFSGEACNDNSECGLPNSVCSSEKCSCNNTAGFEDSNGLLSKGGFCTKSLGR